MLGSSQSFVEVVDCYCRPVIVIEADVLVDRESRLLELGNDPSEPWDEWRIGSR
jgi:hypothetical protein